MLGKKNNSNGISPICEISDSRRENRSLRRKINLPLYVLNGVERGEGDLSDNEERYQSRDVYQIMDDSYE